MTNFLDVPPPLPLWHLAHGLFKIIFIGMRMFKARILSIHVGICQATLQRGALCIGESTASTSEKDKPEWHSSGDKIGWYSSEGNLNSSNEQNQQQQQQGFLKRQKTIEKYKMTSMICKLQSLLHVFSRLCFFVVHFIVFFCYTLHWLIKIHMN